MLALVHVYIGYFVKYLRSTYANQILLEVPVDLQTSVYFEDCLCSYITIYILNLCYSNICYYFAGNPLCPVSSFKKYLSKLHPSKNDLWQKPRDSFEEDSFWYCNAALGKNTLANMMSEICRIAKLPRTYNNHSIRATSITLLDAKFASCDIMKVSGHKSETSIKNYSTKTSEKKMEKMSNFLHTSVAIETVESTTEQLQIGNNSVDMVDESTVQDTLYLNQEQINELLIPMPAEIDLNNKQNKSGSVIQNKSDAVIIQNNQTPLQVVSNSNQQNNMMMPQFQDIINSSFTPYITGCVVNFNVTVNKN